VRPSWTQSKRYGTSERVSRYSGFPWMFQISPHFMRTILPKYMHQQGKRIIEGTITGAVIAVLPKGIQNYVN